MKIKNVFEKLNLKIPIDQEFVNILSYHFLNYQKVEIFDHYSQKHLHELLIDYPDVSKIILECFDEYIQNNFNQAYYLLVYFINFFRNQIIFKKWKILTVCYGGLGVGSILKTGILKTLINSEITVCSFFEFKEYMDNKKFDFIFTTININSSHHLIDCYNVFQIDNTKIFSDKIFDRFVWKKLWILFKQIDSVSKK